MKAGHRVGLSYTALSGGRFRLRWRQLEVQPDGSLLRRQREVVAYSVEERKQLEIDIERQVVERGYWEPARRGPMARPLEPSLDEVATRWMEWKAGNRQVSENTLAALHGNVLRWMAAARAVHGMDPRAPLGVRVLNREDFVAVVGHLGTAGGYSGGTLYQTASAVFDLWGWAHDQRAWEEVVERPPANPSTVMPPAPVYEAPPDVPSWAECDACITRIRHPMARRAAVMMRYTGLRLDQVAHARVEDVDLADGSMLVRKGKSRREQGSSRRVPISAHLVAEVRAWIGDAQTGPLITGARDASRAMASYRNLTRYVTDAWRDASAAGEARATAWQPPNRNKNRPNHAFRAALQHHLSEAGVSERVIDQLVGHAPATTRGRHYAKVSDQAMRNAVASIPAIGPTPTPDNVVSLVGQAEGSG
jgi:integrase